MRCSAEAERGGTHGHGSRTGSHLTDSSSQQAASLRTTRVLYWIYAGRLVACLAVFGSAIVVGDLWREAGTVTLPGLRAIAVAGLGAAALVTPIAYWYSHLGERVPGKAFLFSQALLDLLLITAIVHITGGSQSFFPPLLYIAFVSGYALIFPFPYTLLLAVFVGLAYLADLVAAYPEQLSGAVLFQVAVFAVVAMVASIIGGRLRQVGQELRTLEGELRRLRLGTADVLRTLSSGVITLDESGQVAYMNPSAAELLGVEANLWLGRDLLPELNERAPEIARTVRETIRTRQVIRNREARIDSSAPASRREQVQRAQTGSLPGDGNPGDGPPHGSAGLPVSVSTALHAPSDAPPSVTVVLQDMRPVRQLENLRLRTGRLEAVAELSASLAHEIRNPMASIRSAAEQLSRRAKEGEEEQLLTGLIVRESDRLNRLLGEFNNFARVDVVQRRKIDLERMIREAVDVVAQRPESEGRAAFEVEVRDPLEDVWGDADLLHSVLVNLLLNAVQVGSAADPVQVRVVADTLGPVFIPGKAELGHPVRVRVIDDGPGIDPEDMGRIFDPFFTNRQGGTGMGLAIAFRAVQAHGGVLLASSEPSKGATFSIIIPRRDLENRLSEVQMPTANASDP